MTLPIRRVFVANRGEIAVRVIRACRTLGIETVIGVSEADRDTLGARLADRAVCIGPAPAAQSYLRMDTAVTAAKGTGCQALHPGYGFLAERAAFPRLCAEHGLVFVGPSADAIEAMGDKLRARKIAESLGIPTVPGTDCVASADDLVQFGRRAGYPFLVKASAGGGGRGMRVVRTAEEAPSAFESASAEARAAFGDSTLYIERYVERARHIEIQVIADAHGNVVHLGERDCSTQRRHQKLIEEAPSPVIDEAMRSSMAQAAVRLVRHVSYTNAGTIEFIFDLDTRAFYFLEMNTRIQVEHPVTESITGVDLVAEQIRVAGGAPLSLAQQDVRFDGHAIECRINAEMPERDFQPSPGRIGTWQAPAGAGIRVDTHCYPGYFVPPFYDSMIGKLIVHGRDREDAVSRMSSALAAFKVDGVPTTIPFHQAVLAHPDFAQGRVTTRWVEDKFMTSSAARRISAPLRPEAQRSCAEGAA
ncbi:MAG: acetyl-CoA carboxylase biotin carboxylase subunit [Betaproteobacteria bacterium]|nr:acetyl-CoA carboxylase biotin carboxylase subunit [Betaproteobacteria bacterium]